MIVNTIFHAAITWGYPLIFIATFIEGPIAIFIGAFLASLGYFNLVIIYGVVVIADILADILWYLLGYYGREHFIARYGKYLNINQERIAKLERHFQAHTGKTLFIAKITHAVGLAFIVAAGMAKVRFNNFFWPTLWATLLKSFVFLLIGYYLGSSYQKIDKILTEFSLALTALAAVFVVLYYLHKRYAGKLDD